LTIRKVVHGRLGKIEAIVGVIDRKHVDCLSVVCDAVAGTALQVLLALCKTKVKKQRTCAEFQPSTPT
jgi:hypothetical protein